jgi:hypothetical protein
MDNEPQIEEPDMGQILQLVVWFAAVSKQHGHEASHPEASHPEAH